MAIDSQINTETVSGDEKGPLSVRPKPELFEGTRRGHCQSDQHRDCLRGREHWDCLRGREGAIDSQTNTGTV